MPSAREAERRRRRTVFIAENEEPERTELGTDWYLSGRFRAHVETHVGMGAFVEDLTLDEALAWARDHGDKIVLRIGDEEPRLVTADTDLPRPVRRRVPEEAWKDRTDADPDATWTAVVQLAPPWDEGPEERAAWDAVADAAARALGASWSAKELDGFLADVRRALRSGREYVMTSHPRAYTVEIAVQAPTHQRAIAAARARLPPLPDGWSASVTADFLAG